MLDTPYSEVAWRVLATHSIRQFPLYFPSLRYRVPSRFNWTLARSFEPLVLMHWGTKPHIPRHCVFSFFSFSPWSRVLLEKLTGSHPVHKIVLFNESRRFINSSTRALHLSLSWAIAIQSILLILFPEGLLQCYPPIYAYVSWIDSLPQVSPPKPTKHRSHFSYLRNISSFPMFPTWLLE
jgi:hypothetical protein